LEKVGSKRTPTGKTEGGVRSRGDHKAEGGREKEIEEKRSGEQILTEIQKKRTDKKGQGRGTCTHNKFGGGGTE